jgi:phosphomannomutase
MTEPISFGTDGWRAVIADQFTFANADRAVHAVGSYVLKSYPNAISARLPILIGYDTRFLADKFACRAAMVLNSMGLAAKVADRDVPTPCIAFAAKHEPTAGALQFTASHNPPEYLGIKYIPHYAGPATNEITESIMSYLQTSPPSVPHSEVVIDYFDPKPPYLKALSELVNLKKIAQAGLKVGFDALYSTSREYLDQILIDAGVEVEAIHDFRDPMFGGGMPEPKREYLVDLFKLVKASKLDVGLATDGDADRFAVIDENAEYLSPNQLLCLLTRHLVKNHHMTGSIVRTVATTHLLDRLAAKYNLDVIETPVGFKYIGEIMRAKDVLIGGEESGGVSVKGHIPEKDGILANLLVLEMMAYEKKPLSVIWQDLIKEAGVNLVYRRADYHLNGLNSKMLVAKLKEKPPETLAGKKVSEVGLKDGMKLYIDHENWVLIRPSGTEPLARLYAESTTAEGADALMSDAKVKLEALMKEMGEVASQSAGHQSARAKQPVLHNVAVAEE